VEKLRSHDYRREEEAGGAYCDGDGQDCPCYGDALDVAFDALDVVFEKVADERL
jgi:hypothetical protein